MTPQSAKAKGRNLQKWVVGKLLETFPQLSPLDVKSTSMGAGGVDVQMSSSALKAFPYDVECKARKSFKTIYDMLDQASSHGVGGQPLLVIKGDRKPPLVILDAEYFIKLTGDK